MNGTPTHKDPLFSLNKLHPTFYLSLIKDIMQTYQAKGTFYHGKFRINFGEW